MTESFDEYVDRMARLVESGELNAQGREVVYGEEARAQTFADMSAATGQDNWDDIARVALGRPRLEEHRQQPVIKLRLGTKLARELDNYLEAHPGENKSHVVRSALAQYLKSA